MYIVENINGQLSKIKYEDFYSILNTLQMF